MIHQRYFWRGSGASIGGPRPPPGPDCCPPLAGPAIAPPFVLPSGALLEARTPVPEILKLKGSPGFVSEATCTVASACWGSFIDSKCAFGPGSNCMVLGIMTTKCCMPYTAFGSIVAEPEYGRVYCT